MERYSEYKDSGVQWLGEIPSHWKTVPFKRIIENRKVGSWGAGPQEKEFNCVCLRIADFDYSKLRFKRVSNYTIRSYSSKDFVDRILKKGDILIEKSGGGEKTPVGRAVVYDLDISNAMYANFMEKIKLKGLVSPFFCIYYLSALYSSRVVWKYVKFTTGIQNIDMAAFIRNEKLVFPPKEEQNAIVSYLDTKCSRIETLLSNKEKEITLLQEMKQRIIANAVTRGLNPNVKFKSTNIPWLPEIPEHWEEKRLSTKFTGDIEANKNFEYKHAFKFNYGELVPKNEVGNPEEYKDVYVKYSLIKKGDVLINGLNLNYDFVSQRVACAPAGGIITSAYVVCRPRQGVNYDYYTLLFKAMDNMKLFHGMGTGIRLTLSFKELKKQLLPVPPLSEQHAIVSYITERTSKINSLIEKLNKEIECIKEYKQRLISDVVTGQIKVS